MHCPAAAPQGQRCGGLPACQRKGLLGAQPVGAEKPQKAGQLLAGVLPCTAAGQRTADHGTAAAQLQHRCAGQQIESPPAGRVLPEQPQMRAEDCLKVRLAGQAAQVFGFMFCSGDGLNHGGTSHLPLRGGQVRLSSSFQVVDDILIIPSSDLKIRVQIKRCRCGRKADHIPGLGGTARQLDCVLHAVRVQDGQRALVKARTSADSRLDAGAGGPISTSVLTWARISGASGS